MKCGRVKKLLSNHVDEALPAAQSAEVEAHLDVCPECARERDRLASLVGQMGAMGGSAAPWDLWPGVQRKLQAAALERRERVGVPWLRRRLPVAVPALGAVAAAVVIALTVHLGGGESPSAKADAKYYSEYVRAYSQYRGQQAFADVAAVTAAGEMADASWQESPK